MTIRQMIMASVALALIGGGLALYVHGRSVERDKADLERAEGAVKGLEGVLKDADDFNEAAGGDGDCGWFERLSGVCAAGETAD